MTTAVRSRVRRPVAGRRGAGGRTGRRRLATRVLLLVACLALVHLAAAAHDAAPVLLVYGFQPVPGFDPPSLWKTFAERLSGAPIEEATALSVEPGHAIYRLSAQAEGDLDVYISQYANPFEPTIRDLRFYAARLRTEIAWITRSTGCGQVDLVAHSVGGLVARCYIEASDLATNPLVDGSTQVPLVYHDDVRTLVTLATPHLGATFVAAVPWLGPLIQQLVPGSDLLERLDAPTDESADGLNPNVRYVSMAGQSCLGCGLRRDAEDCRRDCVADGLAWTGSDLVVAMKSADLPGCEKTACIGMDHVDMHTHPRLADAVRAVLAGEPAPVAIYGSEELERLSNPAAEP